MRVHFNELKPQRLRVLTLGGYGYHCKIGK